MDLTNKRLEVVAKVEVPNYTYLVISPKGEYIVLVRGSTSFPSNGHIATLYDGKTGVEIANLAQDEQWEISAIKFLSQEKIAILQRKKSEAGSSSASPAARLGIFSFQGVKEKVIDLGGYSVISGGETATGKWILSMKPRSVEDKKGYQLSLVDPLTGVVSSLPGTEGIIPVTRYYYWLSKPFITPSVPGSAASELFYRINSEGKSYSLISLDTENSQQQRGILSPTQVWGY
jgi:hypothetical protein